MAIGKCFYVLKFGLVLLGLASLGNAAGEYNATLYPCLKNMQLLFNSTANNGIPSDLEQNLVDEALKMERYVVSMSSAAHLCDYIEKKVVVVFHRLYNVEIIVGSVINKLANANIDSTKPIEFNLIEKRYLLSIESLIRKVILLGKTKCKMKHGVFKEKTLECVITKARKEKQTTMQVKESIRYRTWHILAMFLNALSIACQLALLIIYWKSDQLEGIFPRKIVICLAAVQGLLHIFQLTSLYTNKFLYVCTAISILFHWLALCAFVWLNCVSYELNWLLRDYCLLNKEERFIGFGTISFGISAVIVLSCSILHFSSGNSIGYGEGLICFINQKWSMFYAFLLPNIIAFLVNAIWTFISYKKHSNTPRDILYNDREKESQNRQRFSMLLNNLVISLLILLTRGLETFIEHSSTVYRVALLFTSFHGCIIFIGMIANRHVIKEIKLAFTSKERDRITYAYKHTNQREKQRQRKSERNGQTAAVL